MKFDEMQRLNRAMNAPRKAAQRTERTKLLSVLWTLEERGYSLRQAIKHIERGEV